MMVRDQRGFFSNLSIRYRKGVKYQLAHDAYFPLPEMLGLAGEGVVVHRFLKFQHHQLLVGMGYAWNGPSGPCLATKSFMRASLVHDALYDLLRNQKYDRSIPRSHWRKQADAALFRIGIEDGMWRVRAWWTYLGVRLFGWIALWNPEIDYDAP